MIAIVSKGGKKIIRPIVSSSSVSKKIRPLSTLSNKNPSAWTGGSSISLQVNEKLGQTKAKSKPSSTTKRSLASSTAMIDVLPNSIKDAVKTSILEEVSNPDSKLWSSNDHQDENTLNNSTPATTLNNSYSDSDDINNPISSSRYLMLHDPLDEWHIHSQPGSIFSPSNTTNDIKPPLNDANDPFILSKQDLKSLSLNIRSDLIGYNHPVLTQVAGYFFEGGKDGGKKIRPMMVLLLSRAMVASSPSSSSDVSNTNQKQNELLFKSQKRLAEISEMIHTASLFHDDVIDKAETRRGSPAVHQVYGNKMAILAGDYLLARASVFLARLRNVEVVETMSTIIEHLVRGEVMQMKGSSNNYAANGATTNGSSEMEEHVVHYLRKNFYKTASLMANSCKSAAILGNYNDEIVEGAYKYGKHLGIAFQLVDDVLDFDGSASDMGKAALADLNAGLATAPVLFAAEKYPNEIFPMMERKFRNDGDVDRAVGLVRETDGIQRTKNLAQVHVELAIESILTALSPSVYRDALVHLAHRVVDRTR